MLQELSVDQKNAMNGYVPCFHKSHCELEEGLRQLEKIIDLPPFSIADFELHIIMIRAIPIDTVS